VITDDHRSVAQDGDGVIGNLPAQLTRLIDRRTALSELGTLIWRTRLLTLSGPGGAGKTRLAVALADNVHADFVGGAWWVDLSATVDSASVVQVVNGALLPGEPANDPTPAAIARRFAESSLLVLDNCDQVLDGSAELVMNLLARSQSLRVLATSRQPLGVPGEQVFRVPGLALEEELETDDGAGAVSGGAIELFIERAREASNAFDADAPGAREAIRRICGWLDGIPLAIELAAARVPVLGVTQIAERLERDSSFLRHTSRNLPPRHRTLHETLDWSHQLLEPSEQRLLRRLSGFRGGFSLVAAEAVCSDQTLATNDVLDLLGTLVDRSLVQVGEQSEEPRYRLLATVRQYAAAKLAASGETEAVRARHARFFMARAEETQSGLAAGDDVRSFERLAVDHDNLIDALDWCLENAPAEAARFASILWPFWYQRGLYREARSWFERTLAAAPALSPEARADTLIHVGEVAFLQCDYEIAVNSLEAALTLDLDAPHAASALQRLGSIAREQGRYDEARALHQRSLTIWEGLGDQRGVASSQNYLGFVAWLDGDSATAEEMCERALREFDRAGNLQDAAVTLVSLGASALYRNDLGLADERLERALEISRKLGFQEGIAWSLNELAIVRRRRRRASHEQAMMLRDALLVHQQLGDRWRVASVLEELSGSLLARRDARLALETLASADALREVLRAPVPPAEMPDYEAAVARCKRKLGDGAFTAAWSAGRARELDQTIDLVVQAIDELAGAGDAARDRQTTPILTPRELAVLELLSEGQTNREIAAALFISPSTAGVHISNILRKLGAKRRVDAAGRAHALGLLHTH
jgi:predicted ATPase/DNA-binding CsgD family transcriptional regulator